MTPLASAPRRIASTVAMPAAARAAGAGAVERRADGAASTDACVSGRATSDLRTRPPRRDRPALMT